VRRCSRGEQLTDVMASELCDRFYSSMCACPLSRVARSSSNASCEVSAHRLLSVDDGQETSRDAPRLTQRSQHSCHSTVVTVSPQHSDHRVVGLDVGQKTARDAPRLTQRSQHSCHSTVVTVLPQHSGHSRHRAVGRWHNPDVTVISVDSTFITALSSQHWHCHHSTVNNTVAQ